MYQRIAVKVGSNVLTKADGTLDTSIPERRLFVNTLYAFLSVAGKYAEGLLYPPDGPQDLTDELLLLKRIFLGAIVRRPS